MTDRFNEMIILGEAKKDKKGDGVNAVLILMKDIRDFQDKIDTCLQAQTDPNNRAKIESFDRLIDKMYKDLLGIAEGGIKSVRRQRDMIESEPEAEVEVVEETEVKPAKPPVMVNAPVIPKM